MKRFYQENKIELGIDEAGRGCLFGPICIGSVILGDIELNPPPCEIKDSKKQETIQKINKGNYGRRPNRTWKQRKLCKV